MAFASLSASLTAPAPAGGSSIGFASVTGSRAGGDDGIPQGARDVAAAFADILATKGPGGIPAWVWITGAFLAGLALARR